MSVDWRVVSFGEEAPTGFSCTKNRFGGFLFWDLGNLLHAKSYSEEKCRSKPTGRFAGATVTYFVGDNRRQKKRKSYRPTEQWLFSARILLGAPISDYEITGGGNTVRQGLTERDSFSVGPAKTSEVCFFMV